MTTIATRTGLYAGLLQPQRAVETAFSPSLGSLAVLETDHTLTVYTQQGAHSPAVDSTVVHETAAFVWWSSSDVEGRADILASYDLDGGLTLLCSRPAAQIRSDLTASGPLSPTSRRSLRTSATGLSARSTKLADFQADPSSSVFRRAFVAPTHLERVLGCKPQGLSFLKGAGGQQAIGLFDHPENGASVFCISVQRDAVVASPVTSVFKLMSKRTTRDLGDSILAGSVHGANAVFLTNRRKLIVLSFRQNPYQILLTGVVDLRKCRVDADADQPHGLWVDDTCERAMITCTTSTVYLVRLAQYWTQYPQDHFRANLFFDPPAAPKTSDDNRIFDADGNLLASSADGSVLTQTAAALARSTSAGSATSVDGANVLDDDATETEDEDDSDGSESEEGEDESHSSAVASRVTGSALSNSFLGDAIHGTLAASSRHKAAADAPWLAELSMCSTIDVDTLAPSAYVRQRSTGLDAVSTPLSHAVKLPFDEEHIKSVVGGVEPDMAVILVQTSTSSLVYRLRWDQHQVSISTVAKLPTHFAANASPPLLFGEYGAVALVDATTQRALLDAMFLLDATDAAELVRAANRWDEHSLLTYQLETALAFQQADMVHQTLRSLSDDQVAAAAASLEAFFSDKTDGLTSIQDLPYVSFMFLTSRLQRLASKGSTVMSSEETRDVCSRLAASLSNIRRLLKSEELPEQAAPNLSTPALPTNEQQSKWQAQQLTMEEVLLDAAKNNKLALGLEFCREHFRPDLTLRQAVLACKKGAFDKLELADIDSFTRAVTSIGEDLSEALHEVSRFSVSDSTRKSALDALTALMSDWPDDVREDALQEMRKAYPSDKISQQVFQDWANAGNVLGVSPQRVSDLMTPAAPPPLMEEDAFGRDSTGRFLLMSHAWLSCIDDITRSRILAEAALHDDSDVPASSAWPMALTHGMDRLDSTWLAQAHEHGIQPQIPTDAFTWWRVRRQLAQAGLWQPQLAEDVESQISILGQANALFTTVPDSISSEVPRRLTDMAIEAKSRGALVRLLMTYGEEIKTHVMRSDNNYPTWARALCCLYSLSSPEHLTLALEWHCRWALEGQEDKDIFDFDPLCYVAQALVQQPSDSLLQVKNNVEGIRRCKLDALFPTALIETDQGANAETDERLELARLTGSALQVSHQVFNLSQTTVGLPSFDGIWSRRLGTDHELTLKYFLDRGQPLVALRAACLQTKTNDLDVVRSAFSRRDLAPLYVNVLDAKSQAMSASATLLFFEMLGQQELAASLRRDLRLIDMVVEAKSAQLGSRRLGHEQSHPIVRSIHQCVTAWLCEEAYQRDEVAGLVEELASLASFVDDSKDEQTTSRMDSMTRWSAVNSIARRTGQDLRPEILRSCLADDDWLPALVFAATEQYPANQLVALVKEHTRTPTLKEHVLLAIRAVPPHSVSPQPPSSLADAVFAAVRHKESSSVRLLDMAREYSQPMLAVLAFVIEPRPSACMLAFLEATRPHHGHSRRRPRVTPRDSKTLLHRLEAQVCHTCVSSPRALQAAFAIFDRMSPLYHFASFCFAFSLHDRPTAAKYLEAFVAALSDRAVASQATVGNKDWASKVADDMMALVLARCPSDEERIALLGLLARLGYSDRYVKMHRTYNVLAEAGVDLDPQATPEEALQTLLERHFFDAARELCEVYDLRQDDVIFAQLVADVCGLQGSALWADPSARHRALLKGLNRVFDNVSDFQRAIDLLVRLAQGQVAQVGQLSPAEQFALYRTALMLSGEDSSEKLERDMWHAAALLAQEGSYGIDIVTSDLQPKTKLGWGFNDAAGLASLDKALDSMSGAAADGEGQASSEALPQEAVAVLVGALLDKGLVTHALRLSELLACPTRDLKMASVFVRVATGSMEVDQAAEVAGLSAGQCRTSTDLLSAIAGDVQNGQAFFARMLTNFKTATALNMPLIGLLEKDSKTVLHFLVSSGPARFDLARSFIKCNNIDHEMAVQELARCFEAKLLSEAYVERAADRWSSWEEAVFAEYASLAENPAAVGRRLLKMARGSGGPVSQEEAQQREPKSIPAIAQAELLVRAYECFALVCDMGGMKRVKRHVRAYIPQYATAREYRALVRFVTGLRSHRDMANILDTLYEQDMFELLLQASTLMGDTHESDDLRVVLLEYMHTHHPEDTDRLDMLHLNFHMFDEVGQASYDRALASLQNMNLANTQQALNVTLQALETLSYASDIFSKSSSPQCVRNCVTLARLAALQLELGKELVGLKGRALRAFLTAHPVFRESHIVVQYHYPDERAFEWSSVVYEQVIIRGNVRYASHMSEVLNIPATLFEKCVSLFRTDASGAGRFCANRGMLQEEERFVCTIDEAASRLEALLGHCQPIALRYRLALSIGHKTLKNMAMKLLNAYSTLQDDVVLGRLPLQKTR